MCEATGTEKLYHIYKRKQKKTKKNVRRQKKEKCVKEKFYQQNSCKFFMCEAN